jgi:hypothetical protein
VRYAVVTKPLRRLFSDLNTGSGTLSTVAIVTKPLRRLCDGSVVNALCQRTYDALQNYTRKSLYALGGALKKVTMTDQAAFEFVPRRHRRLGAGRSSSVAHGRQSPLSTGSGQMSTMGDTPTMREIEAVVIREKPITKQERVRYNAFLKELKDNTEVVETGLLKVSHALREIQKDRLYREHYGSFEQFIGAELGMGKAYGYRLIKAYDVLDNLLEQGIREANLPNTERLCRELARIKDPKMLKNVWQRVQLMSKQQNKPVDATLVDDVIDEQEGDNKDARRNKKHVKEVVNLFRQMTAKFTLNLTFEGWEQSELKQFRALVDDVATRVLLIQEQLKTHSGER